MAGKLESQLKNAERIRNVLKEVPVSFKLADGRRVRTLLVYLPVKDGATHHEEFFKLIREGILHNFVFSCEEVERKLGIGSPDSFEALFDKAVRKLSRHTAKGELGELILFTLLDVYFKAPKLLSKVAMKTSPTIPVFGGDSVHGQFEGSEFRLYLGESKLHKTFSSGASKAVNSIQSAKNRYYVEFDLLDSFMDFPNIDNELQSKLIDLLNPFSGDDVSDVVHSPCFIGFNNPLLISSANTEAEFMHTYKEHAKTLIANFFRGVEKNGVEIDQTALLMLPFTCIDELVDGFVAYMGITQ